MKIEENSLTIIIPTFNEVDNISSIIERVKTVLKGIDFQLLFVDDDSSDGTIEKIHAHKIKNKNIDIIVRIGRRGLAGACIEGIMAANSKYVAVMDCDLQHDEKILPLMLSKFKNVANLDLVVGSRHVENGNADRGFSKVRKFGSKIATKLTRLFLQINVQDPMSGFFMIKKTSAMKIINKLQPNGFKILADIIASSRGKWQIEEVGYKFKNRHSGKSKMNITVAFELFGLILSHLSFGLISIRFILFGIVGFSGIFVQLFSTFILFSFIGMPFLQSHIFSVLIAMTSNFSLNNLLTYKDRSLLGKSYLKGLISFYFICSIGALSNVAIADFIYNNIGFWPLASIIGALLGAFWNFIFSSIFTWKTR